MHLRFPRSAQAGLRLLAATLLVLGGVPSALAFEGFGAATPGGAGGAVVHVTSLADSGPGTLREALSGGNRTVVFDVAGDIVLRDHLRVRGAFVTIDGLTAPPPGITLRNRGLVIRGDEGAHDVILRGIRVRNANLDGLQVAAGAFNVVIDHVSVAGSGDGNLDITDGARDVTVSWSILAEPASGKNMLIKFNPARISLHHNLFVKGLSRNPNASVDNASTPAIDTTLDMRNNLVWDWGPGFGTEIQNGARANVVRNFYSSPASLPADQAQALLVCAGACPGEPANVASAYVSGNVDPDPGGGSVNVVGTTGAPFPAVPVAAQDGCVAAHRVVGEAGVRPLDALDEQYLAPITPPSCAALFVNDLYRSVLRRAPYADEVQSWSASLTASGSIATAWDTTRAFLGSAEFLALPFLPETYVDAFYRGVLGREPDDAGRAYYRGAVTTVRDGLVPVFFDSPEFAARWAGGTAAAFVTALYRGIMGREPDGVEVGFWVVRLNSREDAVAIVRMFMSSAEYRAVPHTLGDDVRVLYRALIGREPPPAEVALWERDLTRQLDAIVRPEEVAEFQARFFTLFN